MKKAASLAAFVLFFVTQLTAADQILPLSSVQKGMRGHGVTVFEGTARENFDVEILGVLENIAPGQSLILARVDSEKLRQSGVVAGMSGSPIYIDGKVIGALSYGWQFAKEAIAGITPIEEMLRLDRGGAAAQGAQRLSAGDFLKRFAAHDGKLLEEYLPAFLRARSSLSAQAIPIAVPLSFGRFEPATLDRYAATFSQSPFLMVPSGSSVSGTAAGVKTAPGFAPGDTFSAVLVDGDFNVAANGTVTYVDGKRIYGFGHPFLDLGSIEFPMAQAEVIAVLPNLARSFKFSNSGAIVGTLQQDRAAGVMGVVGTAPGMIPVKVTLGGGPLEQQYAFRVVRHPELLPLLLAMGADSVIASSERAAGQRTLMLESDITLRNGAKLSLREAWAGPMARQSVPGYLATIAGYLMSNEFNEVTIDSLNVRLTHDDRLNVARLLDARVETPERGEFHAGDLVKIRVTLQPFRGETFVETLEVRIPDSQPAGNVHLVVGSGTDLNQLDFMLVPPDPRSLEQVLSVIGRLRPSTELVAGIYGQSAGAVTAGVYQPQLPPSIQAVIGTGSDGGRLPVRYHSASQTVRPVPYVISGSTRIDIQITPKS